MGKETSCCGQGCSDCTVCRLRAEVAFWKTDSGAAWDKCEERCLEADALRADLARVTAERDEVRGLFEFYGDHWPDCGDEPDRAVGSACDCGFDAFVERFALATPTDPTTNETGGTTT